MSTIDMVFRLGFDVRSDYVIMKESNERFMTSMNIFIEICSDSCNLNGVMLKV